ncbi:MAG: proton-conducting transporter membrane subunit [Candidatus Omnitrophica bacterium]|nr:proton-conducting transporter membrane subunit [Candidatus Omnitrophota bacterium]
MAYNIIPLFVILPLAGAFINSIIGKRIKLSAEVIANLTTLSLVVISVLALFNMNKYGTLVYKVGIWKPPLGIAMVADPLSVFMLFIVSFVAFLIMVYSINYMQRYTAKWHFYTLFLLMVAGMNGVIITGDIFNLFVFLEIASIASYALVAFGTEKEELEAAFKYLVMSAVGSLFILLGIALIYSYTSTLNMADISIQLMEKGTGNIVLLAVVFFIMGFGLKAALVPFHAWLPDAHPSAPAPISAMLSGVLIKALGVYTIIRIIYNVIGINAGITNILLVLGALSILAGALLAMGQWDFKRLLAYSSISQIGYIILGIGLGTPLGIMGGLFHLFNHSMFKPLLFLDAGSVDYALGTRDMRLMGGLRDKMPVTAGTSLVASMAISGVPPFNGFFSKLIIIFAAVQAGHAGYGFLAAFASILTLSYFMAVQKNVFFGKPSAALVNGESGLAANWDKVKEVPLSMKLPVIVLCIVCIFGGLLLIPDISSRFLLPAAEVLSSGRDYAVSVFKSMGP